MRRPDPLADFLAAVCLVSAAFCAALLLSGCDSCLPENWRVPERKKAEIRMRDIHQNCVQDNSCNHTPQCHRESEARCLDAGYPKTCGNSETESSCGTKVRP